jgi:hypothetical protein
MRRGAAILFAIWLSGCAAADRPATLPDVPTAPPAPKDAPIIITAPVGPPVRVLWAPFTPQPLGVAVRAEPSVAAAVRVPALVPASPEQRQRAAADFVSHFTSDLGLIKTMQLLRDQGYSGNEEWMFQTNFAPGRFADQVRDLISTHRENEIRTFSSGTAELENAWLRPSNGVFGDAVTIGVTEGSVTFTDEVRTVASVTIETHSWRIRALVSGGQFLILDGAESPAALAPMAPFDATSLDAEIASQVSTYLQQETFSPEWTPTSPYTGTAFWDARAAAIDWLHDQTIRGALTDRHFEDMRVQVTQFRPTSFLGDGYVTVHLRGTLLQTIGGARRTYAVDESVVFQRFSFAQAAWLAVDGQNEDGSWIANGNYGTPQSMAHG